METGEIGPTTTPKSRSTYTVMPLYSCLRHVKFYPIRDHYDEYTVDSVHNALYEDVHALLLRLSEGEFDIWEALEELLNYYLNALEEFGSEVSEEEQNHASEAYRCVRACVIQNDISREVRTAGDSFLSSLFADDHDFRVYALWRWCIDSAISPSGFAELGRQVENSNELAESAKSDMERIRTTLNLGADPDSILKAADDPKFEKYIRVMFSLIRCGRFEETMELSGNMGVPWMTLLIRTQQLLTNSSLLGADLTAREEAQLSYRKQAFQIMKKAIAESKYTVDVRMIFAALTGELQFLLPLATDIEDRLWCYANAAVQARLNHALGLDHPVFTPTTVDGIFEAITTVETSPYYVLMNYMMRESWSEAVEWMYSYCKKVDNKPGVNLSPLHRFFGLVVSICRILKYGHDEAFAKDLLSRMIEAMLRRQLFRLTPFYASLLPKDDALTKIWSIMPYVKKESDRKDFIRAMNDAGFDGDDLAVRFGRFRMLDDVDHLHFLGWIFVSSDDKLLYAVAEANTVIRNYLLTGCEIEANAVVNECDRLEVVDRLASSIRNRNDSDSTKIEDAARISIDEFNNHCFCLSALAHCTAFGIAAAKSVAEDEHGGDIWSQQGDLVGLSQRTARLESNQSRHERSLALDAYKARALDAVNAFLCHLGWRSVTDMDWSRTEQLRLLRETFYARVLNYLMLYLRMCDDANAILDLLPALADEDLRLYEDINKEDLKQILLDAHTLVGHAME